MGIKELRSDAWRCSKNRPTSYAGAQEFLLKDISVERLAEAIRTVARGDMLMQPAMTERVMRIVREMGNRFEVMPDPEELTPRERDVLRLIAAGYSNREMLRR